MKLCIALFRFVFRASYKELPGTSLSPLFAATPCELFAPADQEKSGLTHYGKSEQKQLWLNYWNSGSDSRDDETVCSR